MKPLLTIAMLVVPLLPDSGDDISVPYTQFKLDNGLNVIIHEDHTTPLVSVNIWYHVGSAREEPGRTGFAHLFEHIMFEGSAHVPEGMFDIWLEGAGGVSNGSTTEDRTNYWENLPSNALEMALFLESDRMGFLLEVVSPEQVDGQRDVVKNERRQSYENRPYGSVWEKFPGLMYPPDHPYSWPVIGSMADLSAASHADVTNFFKRYYGPNNASLSIAGDVDVEEVRRLVNKWFGEIPSGPKLPELNVPMPILSEEKRLVLEDKVQLPRLYMAWHTPGYFKAGDAEMDILASILADGKNSRLYKRLVFDMQIAQDVNAFQASQKMSSAFIIIATARGGHTLSELEAVIQEEIDKLVSDAPTDRELARAVNQFEAQFLRRLERPGSFGGKADLLNSYYFYTGDPGYFAKDLERYKRMIPAEVSASAKQYLKRDARVIISVVPEGKPELAAKEVSP
ncbi:MAG: insulinase family protein [Candidatus Marinimicrobia bacterium]|nr:insulinase family protein [Candidatus Neomarinimicrobiota bacterium]